MDIKKNMIAKQEKEAFELAVLREIEIAHIFIMGCRCREASGGRYISHCGAPDLTACGKFQKDKISQLAEDNVRNCPRRM